MNIQEVHKIIKEEELSGFCRSENTNENEIVIEKIEDKWIVYTNDEIATKTSIRYFDDESAALQNFINRLRGDKFFRENY